MKSLTQNIQSEIKRQDFLDALKKLPIILTDNGRWTIIPQSDWVSIEEQIVRLNEIISFLSKNAKVLDSITRTKRDQINTYLVSHIIATTIQFINGQQSQQWLVSRSSHIDTLYELVLTYLIIEKKSSSILNEKASFDEIKTNYQEHITKLEYILKNKDIIDKFVWAKDTITIIEELKKQAESRKEEIDKVWNVLDLYEKTYTDTTNNIAIAETTLATLTADNASLKVKWDEVLSEFSEILKNATSGVASVELNKMAENIKLRQRIVFMIIATVLWGLLVLWAYWAFSIEKTILENKEIIKHTWLSGINIENMNSTALVILRRFLLVPFLMLDYFFYRQYEFYKKLKEEYRFKATVSWTLQNYVSILRTNEERQWMKEYVMELTRDILKSPIPNNEDSLDKKWKELLGKVFDNWISAAEKWVSNIFWSNN